MPAKLVPPRSRTVQRYAVQEVAQEWVICQGGVLALVRVNRDCTPAVI